MIRKLLTLFRDFVQFGCFTFGGGWSIITQMQRVYVNKRHEIDEEELLDLTSVARSLPGTMIGNVAMLYGYRVAGALGGIVSVVALVFPPMVILTALAYFYAMIQNNVWVMAAMSGIRAAVVPIIAAAALGLSKSAFRFPPCWAVMILAVVLYLFGVSCVWLVVLGAICGLVISEICQRKEEGSHGAV